MAPFDGQSPIVIDAQFTPKLQCLFQPKRYKVLYGGRGAGRSWGVARALLLIGAQRPIRVLCTRELQNSISESVHKLLGDQIAILGLDRMFTIEKARIYTDFGTEFFFEGIKNNTNKIKSYEGIDYCWVEEALKVSKTSWDILIPTIRKENSEIWMTFNPELEEDYTYVRFVLKKNDSSMIVVKMNWEDNPWFPETLWLEKEECRLRDPDGYLNIWEGFCRQMLEGVVFANELRAAQESGRICAVPWDYETPVDTFWDLGHRDMTSIWFAQQVAGQKRVLGFYENCGLDITHYLKYCQGQPYVYGTHFMPHDASAHRIGEKRTVEQTARHMGFKVQIVPRTHKKVNAINAARLVFPTCWFDEVACEEGLHHLRRYAYRVHDGQRSEEPLHDEHSNAADAFMTMGQALRPPKTGGIAAILKKLNQGGRDPGSEGRAQDWMG